jgi:hypothetical protein
MTSPRPGTGRPTEPAATPEEETVTDPQQDDLTDTDNLVQRTGNGAAPDDPDVEVSQSPVPDLDGEGA